MVLDVDGKRKHLISVVAVCLIPGTFGSTCYDLVHDTVETETYYENSTQISENFIRSSIFYRSMSHKRTSLEL